MSQKKKQLNFRPPSASFFGGVSNMQVKAPHTLGQRNLKTQIYFYCPSGTLMRHEKRAFRKRRPAKPTSQRWRHDIHVISLIEFS